MNSIYNTKSFRDSISEDGEETVIFGVDVLSQPHYRNAFSSGDPLIHTKCSRALPMARKEDIVVLSGRLYQPYYEWLRSFGMGPDRIVEYGQQDNSLTLSQLILRDPEPVKSVLKEHEKNIVFVPFYSGEKECEVASELGAELFGCREGIIAKYFNKQSFKQACRDLDIVTVGGATAKVQPDDVVSSTELGEMVMSLLHNYPRVLLRGTSGSAGSSIYIIDSENVEDMHQQILANHETSLLVEPFLQVVVSPNDQFVIDRQGAIKHLGLSIQLFQELKHTGNLQGQYLSPRIEQYIKEVSYKIVTNMAEHGYCGVLGIDYIVCPEGIFPVENNARMNGSSFTFGILEALAQLHNVHIPCWKFFRAYTEPCTFSELSERLKTLIYKGESAVNVVFPYDCDTLEETGVFTPVILAEDMYHIDFLERALEELGICRV